MNIEELGFYLYMENEEIEKKEELTEDDKINLGLNPFFVGEVSTQNENQSSK